MMRAAARNLDATVTVTADAPTPIRLRIGALTYVMATDEAIDLANKLADAIERIKKGMNA